MIAHCTYTDSRTGRWARMRTIGRKTLGRVTVVPQRPESVELHTPADNRSFQDHVLVHLDAGYNLAYWMLRDEHRASDALQDASLKAWHRFETYRGGDAKSWFLAIVRTCVVDLARGARRSSTQSLDEVREPT